MTETDATSAAVETHKLMAALEQALARHFGKTCRIVSLERTMYAYRSSYELEEVTVRMEDGSILPLLFKSLSWQRLPQYIRDAKPLFLYDPRREIATYRTFLADGRLGTPVCYGSVIDEPADAYWLFLEKVPGLELYQIGEMETWRQVARWLARFHRVGQSITDLPRQAAAGHLLHYDEHYYANWLKRARRMVLDRIPTEAQGTRREVAWLLDCYARISERLLALPKTLIHGEFYASNILVQDSERGLRICAVDWEMAALGPDLMDLAALTSGNWSEAQRATLAHAYYAAWCTSDNISPPQEEFLEILDCCHLHLAIQWLAWAEGWSPPAEHAHDWLRIGLELAEKLDV